MKPTIFNPQLEKIMGYTHYWKMNRQPTDAEWIALMEIAAPIITKALDHVPLAYEYDEPHQKPEVSMERIRFNGVGDDGHETFYLGNEVSDFEFCKTARKPYDPVVVAVLMAADTILGSAFEWSSDGDPEDHADGLRLFNEVSVAA